MECACRGTPGTEGPSQSAVNKPIAVIIPIRLLATSGLLLGLILVLSIACGEESATLAPTATVPASLTQVTVTTPRPTDTPIPTGHPQPPPLHRCRPLGPHRLQHLRPQWFPLLRPTQAPLPSPTAEPTLAPAATPVPITLEVTFPSGDMVVDSDTITVVGITSTDATVSVNGNLVTPDVEGRFAIDLTIMPWENPLAIEVIAHFADRREQVAGTDGNICSLT